MSYAKDIKLAYEDAIALITPGAAGWALAKPSLKPLFFARAGQLDQPPEGGAFSRSWVSVQPAILNRGDQPGSSAMQRELQFVMTCGIRDYSATQDLDPGANLIYDLIADIETALDLYEWPEINGARAAPAIIEATFDLRQQSPWDFVGLSISHGFINPKFGN
jgi:hypothetical protein